jgi:ATP-dependent Zn protease
LITEAEQTAYRLLTSHRAALDAVADRLLDKEVIEGDELRALLERADVVPMSTTDAVAEIR